MSTDTVYRSRSLGVSLAGIPDQYADGKAARIWALYIGDTQERTSHYRHFLTSLLTDHQLNCVLDVACGTGVDSIMLLEEGFKVTSVDASDKMLKYALKERWARRKEPSFDAWVIEEANWLSLDLGVPGNKSGVGFDALVCLGNSFAHLPDEHGDQRNHRQAIANFYRVLRPGGYLIIDHRNYDDILKTGRTGAKNIYYTSKYIKDIITSVLVVNGKPSLITLDYQMDVSSLNCSSSSNEAGDSNVDHFRLSYYPHLLANFSDLLKTVFGHEAEHKVFGDFRPIEQLTGNDEEPAFYVHFIQKPL